MDNAVLNGFMVMFYTGLEKMDKDQRRFVLKSVIEARRILDFQYPQGKPEEPKSDIVIPTGGQSAEILRPNT